MSTLPIAFGGKPGVQGPIGKPAYCKTTHAFTQPLLLEGGESDSWGTVQVNVDWARGLAVGNIYFIEGGGLYTVTAVLSDNAAVLTPWPSDPADMLAAPGVEIAAGKLVVAAGTPGAQGDAAPTNAFAWLSANSSATVDVTGVREALLPLSAGVQDDVKLTRSSVTFGVAAGGARVRVTISGTLAADTSGEDIVISLRDGADGVIMQRTVPASFTPQSFILDRILTLAEGGGYYLFLTTAADMQIAADVDLTISPVEAY